MRVGRAGWPSDGIFGVALLGFDLIRCLSLFFPLQVTGSSRDESSGPRLTPLLLRKMINKSRESRGGVPSPPSQAGMRGVGLDDPQRSLPTPTILCVSWKIYGLGIWLWVGVGSRSAVAQAG